MPPRSGGGCPEVGAPPKAFVGIALPFPAQASQPTAYPVHDEDLAHVQLLLQEFSCDGYRIEEAESPEGHGEKRASSVM